MIPKSALEALNKLVEKWRANAKDCDSKLNNAADTEWRENLRAKAIHLSLCADEIEALLREMGGEKT